MKGALNANGGAAVGDDHIVVEESRNVVGGCNTVDGHNIVDEGCNPVDKGCDTDDVLTGVGLGSRQLLPSPAATSFSICCSLTTPSFALSFLVGDGGSLDGCRSS